MNLEKTNPEIDQDRVEDTVDHFRKFGYIMFPQQVSIYREIGSRIFGRTVVEAGCGNGLGTAVLSQFVITIMGTDKLKENVDFAKCLYPWVAFSVWDINNPYPLSQSEVCVCIETIEHVANPQAAIKNLIDAATEEVWISTPNGRGKERPPSNPYHVCEYTTEEITKMVAKIQGVEDFEILHWKTFEALPLNTDVDPLVYRIRL